VAQADGNAIIADDGRAPGGVSGPPPSGRLVLSHPRACQSAATALADGAVIAHGFANFYVMTTRPDRDTVRSVNLMKGHPADQVGSITTTPLRIPLVYDWSRLPSGLTRQEVLCLMDALLELGPFGFRGPAASHIPDHMAQIDAGVRTAQVIVPGYACPSNEFLARALAATGQEILYITSANRSRHVSGSEDEPAHYLGDGLRTEFGHHPMFFLLEHADEEVVRRHYSMHAPMSTTIVAFLKVIGPGSDGRRTLIVERHGSFHVEDLRRIVHPLGFDLVLGPKATRRLLQRDYAPHTSPRKG
jgi:hypothetical protein